MASKSKAKKRKKTAGNQLLAQAQRNLEKGNYRQALKDAKVCYRQAPTDEHRRLLEFAYIGRAQELQRHGNRDACRGVAEDLLKLGVTEPAVEAALPDLLLWLGMLDRLPAGEEGGDTQDLAWQRKVADQAVLHSDIDLGSWPEIREGAGRVRRALEQLCQGDEAEADVDLQGIARTGPLADWKLFVRGLAAYYQRDFDRMRSNWSRLDPDRAAVKIARPLLALADDCGRVSSDATPRAGLLKIEQSVSQSLLSRLKAFQRQFNRREWKKALSSVGSIGRDLRQLDPALEQRLIQFVHDCIVSDGRIGELNMLVRAVDPLPLDPQWNRAQALARERCERAAPEAPRSYWRAYIRDLDQAPAVPPAQRDLAKAMVWLRLAEDYAEEAESEWGWFPAEARELDDEAYEQAQACLSRCFELAPGYAPAYFELARLQRSAGEPARAAEAYRRLLQQNPDNFDALLELTEFHLENDKPVDAQHYAQRARRLKPLDRQLAQLAWSTHLESARHYALRGEFDRGRDELAAADALLPQRQADVQLLAAKTSLETKAGAVEVSRQLISQALQLLESPAPLWLALTIEAQRYRLPKEEEWFYEKRWTDALKRRCNSSAAGEMSRLAIEHRESPGSYRMPASHVRRLVAYIQRCSRVKWQERDLKHVCQLLEEQRNLQLLDKYATKGMKVFPQCALFHYLGALVELMKGPSLLRDFVVRSRLKKVFNLTEGSSDRDDQAVVEKARRLLSFADMFSDDLDDGDWDDEDD